MMIPQVALLPLILSIVPTVVATLAENVQPRAGCATGFHIIVARAAVETPGEGSTGALADSIAAKVPDSDSIGLRFPALPEPFYNQSETKGVQNLRSDIKSYVQMCPDANIVLLGYDQGAQVVADVLGGSGTEATNGIKGANAKAIKGVILLSDSSHVPGQPYDAGTSKKSGKYPRSTASLQNLMKYSSIMKSYCDKGDTVCASGNDPDANRQYLTKYQKKATKFIVGLYKK